MTVFDLDNWREIWTSLAAHPLRTALTAFGVFWGIFMLMIMLGAGDGLQNGVRSSFAGQATNGFFVWGQSTSIPYKGLPANRGIRLTNEHTAAIKQQLGDTVGYVAPRAQLGGYQGGNNVSYGTNSGGFQVQGDVPEFRHVRKVNLLSGRFLNPLDIDERRKVAVIGTRVRDILFDDGENPLGEHIRINGVYFRVVGLFRPNQDGEQGAEESETIHVPLSTFQQAFNYGNSISWFALTAAEGQSALVAETRVLELLKKRLHIHPEDQRALGHWNMEQEASKISNLFLGIQVLVWIVGTGTLAAGVIGVSNIMLVIIKERTNEIGVRRAIGAGPLAIMGQIVLESILLTSVAGYFGLSLGIMLVDGVDWFMTSQNAASQAFANPGVSIESALQALTILILAGALAGLIPAMRATRINTVEALRGL